MSGSYNLNSTISSNIHFSQVVELEIVDESRVYFTVKGIEGRYSLLIPSILVVDYPVEIGDVEVGDKMLFVVYKDGKSEVRLETYSGTVEGKDDNGLDISIQKEKIKLSFNQLKGDFSKVRIGDIVYLRRRNGRYFKGYFRYYAEQTRPPSDPSTSLDQQFSTIDLESLDPLQPNTVSKAIETQDHSTYQLPGQLLSIEVPSPYAKESNIQEIESLKKSYLYPVSQTFIETLKHFFHAYRPMVYDEDSFYRSIFIGYLETLCNSIYPSNILSDLITKLTEAQGMYAVNNKIQGLRERILSHLNYLLSLKRGSYVRNSDLDAVISYEGFIRPLIIELRGLVDKLLRESSYYHKLGHIPLSFEHVLTGLSEILNIKIFLFDIRACTYSQYGDSKFNFILYYLNNNESLDRLYLHYDLLPPDSVSHSDLDKYRCNLCKLLPHESVLSLEDTCYCSNCLGYLVSKGMISCNICKLRHSSLTIQTIKKKRYSCSSCQSEYNYLNFTAEIQCTHGLCKACTRSSMRQAACKGCGRGLRPEEVQVMIKCEICKENKVADKFTIEKVCKCDICDDCVLEAMRNSVKCRICNQYLTDTNLETCLECGKIDSYENGMMPGCNHFLCRDCSIDALTSEIDNLRIRPTCSTCHISLKPSEYSNILDPKKDQILISDQQPPKVDQEDKEYECGICKVPYKIDNIRILHCDHSFCDDCMMTYILSWLDNTIKPRAVTCPQCPIEISPVIIQAVMPTIEFDNYNRTCFNASNNRCWECRTVLTIIDDKAHCTSCDLWLCKVCLQNYHEGDCDPRFLIELKPISYMNKRSYTCPSCKHEYFDSHMRDKAICIDCFTKFCLICYEMYNPIQVHGYHFHSPECTRYKSTIKPDKFDPACIHCRQTGSLCAIRTIQIPIDT